MKPFLICGAVLLLGLTACSTLKNDGAETLFNGHDMKNWVVMHGGEWSVQDGVLVGRNGTNWSTNPEKSGSWLRSAKEYGDFVLELDFAINTNGNSGVFLRSGTEKNPAFTGYEMQILGDHGRAPAVYTTGSLYDVVAPTKNASKPAGEWNHAKISSHGKHIHIEVNGEPVVDFHDATRSERGYIGLQNHDNKSVVKYKNITIKPV